MRAHGVPEIKNYLEKNIDKDTCIEKIQQVTRNYVKRQHTWWKTSKLEIFKKINQFPDEIDTNSMNFVKFDTELKIQFLADSDIEFTRTS